MKLDKPVIFELDSCNRNKLKTSIPTFPTYVHIQGLPNKGKDFDPDQRSSLTPIKHFEKNEGF